MPKVDAIHRETIADWTDRLEKAGQRTEFLQAVKDYRLEHGCTKKDAQNALSEQWGRHKLNRNTGMRLDWHGNVLGPWDGVPGDSPDNKVRSGNNFNPPHPPPQPKPERGKLRGLTAKQLKELQAKPTQSLWAQAEWIFNNLPIDKVDPDTCPSAGAWGWLQELKASATMRQEFYNKMMPKMMGGKQDADTQGFTDDDNPVIDLANRLIEYMQKKAGNGNHRSENTD